MTDEYGRDGYVVIRSLADESVAASLLARARDLVMQPGADASVSRAARVRASRRCPLADRVRRTKPSQARQRL